MLAVTVKQTLSKSGSERREGCSLYAIITDGLSFSVKWKAMVIFKAEGQGLSSALELCKASETLRQVIWSLLIKTFHWLPVLR